MKKTLLLLLTFSFFSLKAFVSPAHAAATVKYGGMVVGYNHCEDYGKLDAVWGHTYDTHPPICPGIESVPVFDLPSNAEEPLGGNSRWIIGYNEPDRRGETPHAGAVAWHRIEERFPDKLLVAPGVVGGDPLNWLTPWRNEYMALYKDANGNGIPPRIDALNLHCYFGVAQDCLTVLDKLKQQARAWNVGEIWVTEFGAPYQDCKNSYQIAEVKKFVDALNSDPMVTRYSWYQNRIRGDEPWIPSHWCNLGLLDYTKGELTEFGQAYKNEIPPACPTGFNVSCNPAGNQATISWGAVSGSARYILRLNKEPYNDWFNTGQDQWIETTSPSVVASVTPGANYTYDVQGITASGTEGCRQPFAVFNCAVSSPTPIPPTRTPTPRPPTPTPLPGDLDKSGKVDIFDYNFLVQNFGRTRAQGFLPPSIDPDIVKNDVVDIFDYNILVGNFGK